MVAPSEILSEVIPKISILACCFANLKSLKCPICKVLKTPDIKVVKWNFYNDFTHKKPYTKNSLKEQIESDAMQLVKCSSTTLYKEFAFNLLKNNLFNPFNIIFLIIGIYTYFIRTDMRELIFIVRKLS